MTLLDLLVVVVVAASTVAGFVAGFARGGIGFIAAIFGVLFGFWFYGTPASYIHQRVHSEAISNVLGFLVVFMLFILAGALVARLVVKFLKLVGLSWLDRLVGGAFGMVRGALVALALIAILLAFVPKPAPNWMKDSLVLPYAMDASGVLASLAPGGIKIAFREAAQEIRQEWREGLEKTREVIEGKKPKREEPPEEEPKPKRKKKKKSEDE